MSWGRRVTSALAVFAVGSIAALPFYHGPLPSEAPPYKANKEKAPPAASPNPSASVALQIPASDLESTATAPISSIVANQSPDDSRPPATKRVIVERDVQPPIISNEFPGAAHQVPQVNTNPIRSGSRSNSRPRFSSDNESHGDGPKVHRIRDGDTLRKIAERYLRNGDLWIEILDANRSILRDPEVLPVGKEIKIPEPKSWAPELSNTTIPTTQPTNPPDEPLTPLVPIR